jgi:hypothetical protein
MEDQWFSPAIHWLSQGNLNIVESDIKHYSYEKKV